MDKEKEFITTFMIAVSNCSLYSKEHESFDDLAKKTLEAIHNVIAEKFELMMINNDLVINNTPLRSGGLHKTGLIKRLHRKGLSRIDFLKGVTLPEIKQMIVDFSSNRKGLKTYPHIKSGSVDINATVADSDILASKEEVAIINDVFSSISDAKKLKLIALQEVVTRFLSSFRNESDILHFLIPVKSYSEYTYIHAMNVAVLTMFQARSLGFDDNMIHEMGIAALLHDIGKLFISKDVLEKNGKLDDREFTEIKSHVIYGPKYLAKMDNVTRLAPIAAFEHHMKFDGSGYPKLQLHNNKQHICSQIVAISDFFDALRSRRPYRESIDIITIISMMKEISGKDFNPSLLDNFISNMGMSCNQLHSTKAV
jgi:putative nucleotidyltransferase with HDIG domain